MRAARLIKMVLLLQSRPVMSAAELAAELEVSERTVTRDAQALSEAGVPVYTERGRAGGYRLVGGYRTRLTGLARDEAEALFLSGLPSALREMGLEDAASAARLKVSAALLPSLRDASSSAARRFHLDAPSWYHEPQTPELLPAVADAVWDDRVLRTRYRKGGGRAGDGGGDGGGGDGGGGDGARGDGARGDGGRAGTEVARELAPYGLVLKAGVWYLCAQVGDDFRVYRIDRFTAVEAADERFERDETFDLPGFWEARAADFARSLLRTEVTVRVSGSGARQLAYTGDRAAAAAALAEASEAGPDGWRTLTLPVESLDVAYSQLLALGPELEVLAPESLRARFAGAAERLAELYR